MKFLVRNARGKIIEDAEEKRDDLIQTFQEHLHNKYNKYAAMFYICETTNLLVVISQIFVVNRFLNYEFLSYGPEVWHYYSLPPEERVMQNLNPMCEAFPRIASCDFVRQRCRKENLGCYNFQVWIWGRTGEEKCSLYSRSQHDQ